MTSEPERAGEVAVVSLEQPYGYQPERYVGVVIGTGATVSEAVQNLQEHAEVMAQEDQPSVDAYGNPATFAVLGLRMAGGITVSGQPEWVAYGTLARSHRHVHQPRLT